MNCTCTKCGTVHFVYSREQAEKEVATFNEYFYSLSEKERQENYGSKPSSISRYEKCGCGSKVFREYRQGDCPDGVTIGPVIWEQ